MDQSVPPDRYRRAWTRVWRVVVALGFVAAALTRQAEELLASLWVGGVLGVVAAGMVLAGQDRSLRARPLLTGAAWGATGLAAMIAVVVPQPAVAFALLALAALSCPALVAKVSHRPDPPPRTILALSLWHCELLECPDTMVGALETSTLCVLWRDTGTWLSQSLAVSTQLSVVRLRGALIEELERRFPERAAAWLQAEGLAASDPARFLG